MVRRALFIGRFQPFHHGHLSVIKSLLDKYDEVIVSVGSAESPPSPDNPFSSGERVEMIRAAFSGSELSRLIIIPVRDVDSHLKWVPHVLSCVPAFEAVYSNNALVGELFRKAGIRVEPIQYFDRGLKEGRLIRDLMAKKDDEWRRHIPPGTAKYIDAIGGVDRVRKIMGK